MPRYRFPESHRTRALRAEQMLLDGSIFRAQWHLRGEHTSTVGCVAPGKRTPADATGSVTSISLPATYNPSGYFTCLDFTYTVKGLAYGIFLVSSPASPGTWVQNNIANCAPGPGITLKS